MCHKKNTRCFVGTAVIALLVIISLTYQRAYNFQTRVDNDLLSAPRPDRTAVESAICPASSDFGVLLNKPPLSQQCNNGVTLPYVGELAALGEPNRCFHASARFDQYRSPSGSEWQELSWGRLQTQCGSTSDELSSHEEQMQRIWRQPPDQEDKQHTTAPNEPTTAIVLRTWDNYDYSENRLAWLRALIAEATRERKGRYRVFFLVNIKDPEVRLEEDTEEYQRLLNKCVPREFRDMSFLFNERTLKAWYPLISEHGAQDQMYQALQIFSAKFPEYEFLWQLEMDLRFTSHVHDTLEAAAAFSRNQKRRNLWERNGRFYIPALYNDSYENFVSAVDNQIGDTGIWGPVPTRDFVPLGPHAPIDDPRWGIDEEADLISFMPMIDPRGTKWVYEDILHGFADEGSTPRRLAIVSITRSSRHLLRLISDAQRHHGLWIVSEATLETFSLLHGLKAVTVPHPIFFNMNATAEELESQINKGPPSNKAGGELSSMLYTTEGWAGGPWLKSSYWFAGPGAQYFWDMYKAGTSLPPILLHPVKEE